MFLIYNNAFPEANPWLTAYFDGIYDVNRVVTTQFYRKDRKCRYQVNRKVLLFQTQVGRGFESNLVIVEYGNSI